jgi:hypothetical protein
MAFWVDHVGAVAFSRTGDAATGDFSDAKVIRKFALRPVNDSLLGWAEQEDPMKKETSDVHSLKPGNLESRQVFEEVGRAIVHLSDIENLLASIFHSLVLLKAPSPSMEIFYDQGGFEKKMKLVDYIFHLEGSKEELERWKKIAAELEEHRAARNLIAHYGMYIDSPDRDGRVDVVLHPPWLKGRPDKKGNTYGLPKSGQPRAR